MDAPQRPSGPPTPAPGADEALRRAWEGARWVQDRAREIRRHGGSQEEIIREFSETAREMLGSAATQFYSRDPGSRAMVLRNRTGDTAMRRIGQEPWRPSPELIEWVARARRTTMIPGDAENLWHVIVPLVVAGEVHGVLAVNLTSAADDIPQHVLEGLSFLAEETASTLIAAEEQDRIARELARTTRERTFLANILDSVANGIIVLDLNGRILQINRNAAAMLDLPSEDLAGQMLDPLLPPAVQGEIRATFHETVGMGFSLERLITAMLGGVELPLAVGSSLLRDEELKTHGVIIAIRDMTASREMERLRKLDQMKSDFVANVSHELRTPLTSIKAYCEALEGMATTDQQAEFLKVIDEESDRLLGLIEDLLNFSRIASGKLKLNVEPGDLGDLVREVVTLSRLQSPAHALEVRCPDDLPEAVFDWNRMKEVLINLVSNAIKYSPAGGTVRVELSTAEGNVRIDVSDEGIGISEADQKNLFQQFFRVDGSLTAQVSGTGLGLAIVKGIAEAHGGTVMVRSSPGQGSTFSVLLPIRREAPREPEPEASPF
ncbi:MAG: PAS domain S-box protein [Candidatus Brocadiae bacterium]|nr:PAS domain S-box protein [Candidatus Brocadiia bacterium]